MESGTVNGKSNHTITVPYKNGEGTNEGFAEQIGGTLTFNVPNAGVGLTVGLDAGNMYYELFSGTSYEGHCSPPDEVRSYPQLPKIANFHFEGLDGKSNHGYMLYRETPSGDNVLG